MSQEIQISSVMLCFNRLTLSRKCLNSYLETIQSPHELIIVDNASTDGTAEWLEGFRKDPRITAVIHMLENNAAAALNRGFAACTGQLLHLMENDYVYLDGWDRYAVQCFREIPELGQLSICSGARQLLGDRQQNLIYRSVRNVVSSSVFRRAIFFDHHVRWQNIYNGLMPDDAEFSHDVKEAGFLVAWPDRPIADALGVSPDEIKRDPHYYLRNYRQKLQASLRAQSLERSRSQVRTHSQLKENS